MEQPLSLLVLLLMALFHFLISFLVFHSASSFYSQPNPSSQLLSAVLSNALVQLLNQCRCLFCLLTPFKVVNTELLGLHAIIFDTIYGSLILSSPLHTFNKSNCLTYKCSKNTIREVYYKKILSSRRVTMKNKVLCLIYYSKISNQVVTVTCSVQCTTISLISQ